MDQSLEIDPSNGFNSVTKTFHSLRPPVDLPSEDTPLSAANYAFSLRLNSPWPDSVALISSSTGQRIFYSEFEHRSKFLAANLQTLIGLSKGDTAFILSENSIKIPILYFSLLTLGVVISPANPISTDLEIIRLTQISKPVIAFATKSNVHKLKRIHIKTIFIDSPEFDALTTSSSTREIEPVEVSQSDLATIMYSSGTTGKVKGVMSTHRNLIAMVAGIYALRTERKYPAVVLYTVPYFHVFGFFYCAKSVAMSETVVVMERFELKKMLRNVDEYRVTHAAVVPPIVVAMAKSRLGGDCDLSSLEIVICGAAPLSKDVIQAFKAKFLNVLLVQGYGLTEATGAVFRLLNEEEARRWGSAGRLYGNFEARIMDPETGVALPPGQQGELWIRGPSIMKGYVGDEEAALVAGGWLRTGDLCYIDKEGYLFVVDRLKELIKYKGYQVAPAELEQLLLCHPEIVDAAVIPYLDKEAGEVPMTFVVKNSKSSLDEKQVMDFVAKQVASYKKIRRVAFVDSIPKSAAGKILRRELRKSFLLGSMSRL